MQGLSQQILMEMMLDKATKIADGIEKEKHDKEMGRKQQAMACMAIASSMGQAQNIQPENNNQQPTAQSAMAQ